MTMTISAAHWYSWDFTVTQGERHIASVGVSGWREKGVLTIDGVEHRVSREGAISGDFLLLRNHVVLARATKPSWFKDAFEIRHEGRTYELTRQSAWRRRYVVRSGNVDIGSIAPTSMWNRDAVVTLPDRWPPPLKAFVIWLVIVLWKRGADGASAG